MTEYITTMYCMFLGLGIVLILIIGLRLEHMRHKIDKMIQKLDIRIRVIDGKRVDF